MKKTRRKEYTLSSPSGVLRVVQYFNSKGEEYSRQYFPISSNALLDVDRVFRTNAALLKWCQSKSRLKEKEF